MLTGGDFFQFRTARFPEVTKPAFFERAVRKLQRDLWWPTGFGFGHVFHNAHSLGNSVHHDFAEIALAGRRVLGFAHGSKGGVAAERIQWLIMANWNSRFVNGLVRS